MLFKNVLTAVLPKPRPPVKALPTISEDKATPGLFCSNLFISVLISSNASSLSLPAKERT